MQETRDLTILFKVGGNVCLFTFFTILYELPEDG